MKLLSCGALLLFAATAVAQQHTRPPYNPPPSATVPTVPQDQQPQAPISHERNRRRVSIVLRESLSIICTVPV